VKSLRLEVLHLRRRLERSVIDANDPDAALVESVVTTPAYDALGDDSEPEVTVITAVHRHGTEACGALESVAASRAVRTEAVVVDDGSDDGSAAIIQAWMAAHPTVAVRLVRHRVNRGLGAARNTALDFARAPAVFVLDADNRLYEDGLALLLHGVRQPGVDMAYGILECFDALGPSHLLSAQDWEPARLRQGNYIDAMAMISTDALREHGGYTTDLRLHGWEDYDLWCGFAEAGRRGQLVRTIVGRYRQSPGSMRSLTDLDDREAFATLEARHPQLFRDPAALVAAPTGGRR
jgi:glycosyltransferase involved in cell wall biosynthesis